MRQTSAQRAAEKHHKGPGRLVVVNHADLALAADGTLYKVALEQRTETPEGGEPLSHEVAKLTALPIEWPEED